MAGHRDVTLPDRLEEEEPEFSGIIRYEADFEVHEQECCQLEITDADQCAIEVFLNGKSIGLRATTPCRYDLDGFMEEGINHLVIEAATTAERENAKNIAYGMPEEPDLTVGIYGRNGKQLYMFFNESVGAAIHTDAFLDMDGYVYRYDALADTLYEAGKEDGSIRLDLEPYESDVFVVSSEALKAEPAKEDAGWKTVPLPEKWKVWEKPMKQPKYS